MKLNLITQAFPVGEACNQQNFKLYFQYLQTAVVNHRETLNTTYKTYCNNMKLFFKYIYEHEGNPYIIDQTFLLSFTDVWERYSFFCFENGNNKRTLANKRSAIFSFFDWCVRKHHIPANPFIFIEKMKFTDSDKVRKSYFLNSQEIWKIKYFLNEGEYIYKNRSESKKLRFDLQDNLIFNLFLDTGARISEIHGLTLEQLDLHNLLFLDVRLKEGYVEPLIFFEETQKILKEWLEYREKNNLISDFIFITKYKNRINQMSKETIRATIRKIGLIVGIENFYPHSIRKTIINIAAQSDEQLASTFAHHSSLGVTRRHYVKKKSIEAIRNQMQTIRNKAGI
ncbi:tyrosine-type recombinase/integrase [uncultured Fusobacterium sp.]|uniref:tyrosine-type recombinase/integrase n=1 Tax=uncultured Fusobacterium sp. TaxID=159267 RepID=UPI0025F72834|nr:tyrosine-type recombinase/integrase [uncultured Fusobacterium sp.]